MGIAVDRDRVADRSAAGAPPAGGAQDDPRGPLPRRADGWRRALADRSATSRCRRIRPTLLIATVLTIIISLQTFDVIFQLTKGGPGFDTTTMTYYIFDSAINKLSLGYSAAIALLLLADHRRLQRPGLPAPRPAPSRERLDNEDLTADEQRSFRRLLGRRRRGRRSGGGGRGAGQAVRAGGLRADAVAPAADARRASRVLALIAARSCSSSGRSSRRSGSSSPALQPEGRRHVAAAGPQPAPDFDHFVELLTDKGWQGSIFVSLEVVARGDGAHARASARSPPTRWPGSRCPARRVFLGFLIFTPDGPGDRARDPGAADLQEPGPQGHDAGTHPGQHGVPAAARRLAAA